MSLLRPFTASLVLAASLGLTGQDVHLQPKWRKGDTRSMFVTKVSTDVKADGTTAENTERLDAKVRVTNMTATTYMLELEYRNVVLTQLQELGGSLGAELDPWRRLVLRYEIDRSTGEAALYNWQDVRDAVNGSFNEIKRGMRRQDPELAEALIPSLEMLTNMLQTREAIDGYFRGPIDILTFTLGKPLQMGQELILTGTDANPFGEGRDSLTVVTTVRLDALDRDARRCTISATQEMDVTPVIAMMKELLANLMKSTGGSTAELERALAAIDMDVRDERTIVMDLENAWPVRAERTTTVIARSPEGTSTRMVRMNAEVR